MLSCARTRHPSVSRPTSRSSVAQSSSTRVVTQPHRRSSRLASDESMKTFLFHRAHVSRARLLARLLARPRSGSPAIGARKGFHRHRRRIFPSIHTSTRPPPRRDARANGRLQRHRRAFVRSTRARRTFMPTRARGLERGRARVLARASSRSRARPYVRLHGCFILALRRTPFIEYTRRVFCFEYDSVVR